MKRTRYWPTDAEVILSTEKLTKPEIRLAVSNYLDIQERRKRADMQLRHLGDKDDKLFTDGKPSSHGAYLQVEADVWAVLEDLLKKTMLQYAKNDPVGQWILSLHGVGEVIAAGMLAHIDIEKAKTAGAVWKFAGQVPGEVLAWTKGKKRPYNAQLKQVCYQFSICQVKVSKHPDAYYGRLYREKKLELIARNERGGFADKAKVYKGVTDAANKKLLAQGKVPAAYIDKMARRFATKIFLSHLHAIMHFVRYGTVPVPFAHAHLGHIHLLDVPNHEMFPGFIEAYRGEVRKLEAAE